jgi:CheY-like chemotaxis protein
MKEMKDIQFASNFEHAMPLLTRYRFDLIVVDINLPGDYNGLDILRIIRRMPEYEGIPVIAVTAYMLPGDKEKFIAAGFSDFVPKPILRMKMIDSIEKIFLAHI